MFNRRKAENETGDDSGKNWRSSFKGLTSKVTGRKGDQNPEAGQSTPHLPSTPIADEYAAAKREQARQSTLAAFHPSSTHPGHTTSNAHLNGTNSALDPRRGHPGYQGTGQGPPPSSNPTPPFESRWTDESVFKEKDIELDSTEATAPPSREPSKEPPAQNPHTIPPLELSADPVKPKIWEMSGDPPEPKLSEVDGTDAMPRHRNGQNPAELSSSPRLPQASNMPQHNNGGLPSFSERTNGTLSSPSKSQTGASAPAMSQALAGARGAFQNQPQSATQRKAVLQPHPQPNPQSNTVPAHVVPPRNGSVRPGPSRPTPTSMLEPEPAPEKPDQKPDFHRETSNLEDDSGTDQTNDDECPSYQSGQSMEPTQRQSSGFRDKFRINGSNKKQSQTLHKNSVQGSNVDEWSRRLKRFQKDFKVPKNSIHDQLGMVLEWAANNQKALDSALQDKDQETRRLATNIRNQTGEITRLKSVIDSKEREIHQMQKDWTKAESAQHKAEIELATLKSHTDHVEEAQKVVQDRLHEVDQHYKRAIAERNSAREEASYHERREHEAATELQRINTTYTTVVGERNQARHDCHVYWGQFQQADQELKTTRERLQQVEQELGITNTERNEYKQSSDRAHNRCVELEGGHKKELTHIQTMYSHQLKTFQDEAKRKHDKLETELANVAVDYQTKIDDMQQRHAEEITRRDAEAKEVEDKYKAKLKSETARLQGQVTTLKTHMASYSNTDNYKVIRDDELRDNFLHLARGINNLINYVPRPSTYSFDPDLDPDNFLGRNSQQGGRNWPKFIRHICWRAIIRGFFSRPLGFGALGCQGGEGFEALDQVYQLFAVADPKDPRGPRVILPNTKEMNTWRAGLFEALLTQVRQGSASNNRYLRLFRANLQLVTDDLVASLHRVSGNQLSPQASGEITGFVQGLGTLALEMAAQRAHIFLEACEHGERVSAEKFKDESDMGSGSMLVDLMIQPCIRRVGDGRDDLKAERVIVRGDFVSVKAGY
ncbi:hypothetical protein FALBO_5374 [Fusarium albosuccineum]|uniref:Uncharacterized protein n=1 Tax=Fusarium albosuccineum TaxID=1237068 RepID=A0A8H4LHJ3_9HYPO|nr:hypothetical protein FALBO_5374 [Fusarium albosuccineum]